MNLPKDFLEVTNIFIPTEYSMPENYTQDFDDSIKLFATLSKTTGWYIDNTGKKIEIIAYI